MKTKYVFTTIICCIMFITCYKSIGITSSASEYPVNNNSSATNMPYVSIEPSLIPVTKAPTKQISTSNSNGTKGSISNTISPSLKAKNPKKPKATKELNKITPKATQKTSDAKPIKIPTIYTPYLSGKTVYKNTSNTAHIDVSNKDKGYIGVKYSGDNKKVKVQIIKSSQTYNYDLPSDDKYVIYPLQLGNGTYSINVLENVSGTQYMSILNKEINVQMSNPNYVFLYPNQYVWFTQNSDVVKRSAAICNGYTKSIDKISAIFKYVTTNISYDYAKAKNVKSGYLPNVDNILITRKGICFDYAAMMAAMCRAQGIPTKLITGYVSPNGVYHAWNEVYTKEKGWITVSFYLGKTGFNIVDPTFYSNMDDSKEAADYIGNGSNYKRYHIY